MPELLLRATGDRLRLLRQDGGRAPRRTLLGECALPAQAWHTRDALAQALAALCETAATHAGGASRLGVVLPDATARYFMVSAPRNATRLADCAAAAGQRFQEIYGEPAQAWQIAADWDARHAFLACALPRATLDALRDVAAKRQLQIASVAPYFIAAWNRRHAAIAADAGTQTWFAALDDHCLTLAALADARVHAVRSLMLSPSAAELQDAAWLPRQLEREALRLGLPTPRRLQLCGALPADSAWRRIAPATLQCELLADGDSDLDGVRP